jgi:GNAT superfamily N-acetyltransferase
MEETTLRRIDDLWARRLGCDASRLGTPGFHALEPDEMASPPALFLLARAGALLVRGAPDATRLLLAVLGGDVSLPSAALIRATLGTKVDRVVGPALLGYRDAAPELPPGPGALRCVAAADRPALSRLREAVTSEEWEHSGLGRGGPESGLGRGGPESVVFGAFEGGRLLAAASFERLLGVAAHLGVLTHPAARGRGAGRRVVACAARAASGHGLLLQYQTLEANRASLRIAETLGFECYARSLAVRIRIQP